jgi:hypothetical protein
MNEFLLLMVLLFAVYLFMPGSWHAKFSSKKVVSLVGEVNAIPEDSVLRRHYITQLRSEIEQGLSPRPTDFTLQRHYDALVSSELENRLASSSSLTA